MFRGSGLAVMKNGHRLDRFPGVAERGIEGQIGCERGCPSVGLRDRRARPRVKARHATGYQLGWEGDVGPVDYFIDVQLVLYRVDSFNIRRSSAWHLKIGSLDRHGCSWPWSEAPSRVRI